ncbi:tRNA (cytidine(34)-2'-O)-methyltransferase [Syntrophomonas palmitatica]|uniref:tRNA (cytidine(34)-2'-O)-methyltransferase n=1 Tax=Syntrophomonas palmitatica TaxID=402877 RepID=UPI0006D169C6|nr:tRNA (cytidine(34)-2'-O)-methyltransferase [Syntrophomonas palmitatica]
MHIVLVEPEIPQNTGNIARSCALTGCTLHLVGRLGFSLEDRYLKRAGLDYWEYVNIIRWTGFHELLEHYQDANFYLATTKAQKYYNRVSYQPDDMLVFGAESRGLPEDILSMFPDKHIRIPMINMGRSLNLSNAAAIIIYEALRQMDFPGLD